MLTIVLDPVPLTLNSNPAELAIDDELDLDKVMKDHAALLLQIDNVLVKSEGSQPVVIIGNSGGSNPKENKKSQSYYATESPF